MSGGGFLSLEGKEETGENESIWEKTATVWNYPAIKPAKIRIERFFSGILRKYIDICAHSVIVVHVAVREDGGKNTMVVCTA
jgi:hypothetical protein